MCMRQWESAREVKGAGDKEVEWFEAGEEPDDADHYFDADDGTDIEEREEGDSTEDRSGEGDSPGGRNRADNDVEVEAMDPESLEELWVFFGMWNDDGTVTFSDHAARTPKFLAEPL
uniref:Uncharacterized protein n=1 Tax=Chromera velia CCMP2878 TaxID=1169474 RepID=A0A0G4HWG8_9ALVE|eukprot:Cvel_9044.t1-p1 / transcript=Cvel_9044.t1 / gene=Cvel_9044 / organism=Chromera_velia_CCMP2878 / gene_product=hypothetical protein / transcript_product=hypothetical protein / location=Cvel_scaffold512:65231-67783(+) / protein_length=116 / sequence_SO=supercontig / SO=protein_coding / is_pseudo=false